MFHIYRATTLGITLQDTLDEQLQLGRISPALAVKILQQFDKSINTALSTARNKMVFHVSLTWFQ